MSRSGYSFYGDPGSVNLYRGNIGRTIAGKKGQAFLKELAGFMDAMPEKILIENELIDAKGQCCTMGVYFKAKGIDVSKINPNEYDQVAGAIGISEMMVREIAFENDEAAITILETPAHRWVRMRGWVSMNLKKSKKGN